jgi:hypothetical protein
MNKQSESTKQEKRLRLADRLAGKNMLRLFAGKKTKPFLKSGIATESTVADGSSHQ